MKEQPLTPIIAELDRIRTDDAMNWMINAKLWIDGAYKMAGVAKPDTNLLNPTDTTITLLMRAGYLYPMFHSQLNDAFEIARKELRDRMNTKTFLGTILLRSIVNKEGSIF